MPGCQADKYLSEMAWRKEEWEQVQESQAVRYRTHCRILVVWTAVFPMPLAAWQGASKEGISPWCSLCLSNRLPFQAMLLSVCSLEVQP